MIRILNVILISMAIFLATVVNMAFRKNSNTITARIALIAAVGGLAGYGYAYTAKGDPALVAVARTVISVCEMFIGKIEVPTVMDAPLFSSPLLLSAFWALHFLALYALASVVMTTLGASILKKFRIWLLKKNDLAVIFGVSSQTVLFANRLRDERNKDDSPISLLFVSDRQDAELARLTDKNGWVLRTDPDAVHPNSRFLRSIGVGKNGADRRITLYALSLANAANRRYASEFLEALKEAGVPDSHLSLTISTDVPGYTDKLQAQRDRYGYTDIKSFELQALTANLLTLQYPPCDTVRFREDGTCAEDIDILIAGFGTTGQNVLLSLTRSAQFTGCRFRAAVYSPDIDSRAGCFFSVCDEFCRQYPIRFVRSDARSIDAAEFVRQHVGTLKYIVACTENERTDWEIIRNLQNILGDDAKRVLFLICGEGTVTKAGFGEVDDVTTDVWRDEILTASVADRAAKVLNASYYKGSTAGPEELWRTCTPFSRESCRAAADFIPAYCRMAGISPEDAAAGRWDLSADLLENMARTEHLRWNAFHRSMGWRVMSDEEFDRRAALYLAQKNGRPTIRIAKNDAEKHHACLVSWEELAVLSDKENAVTGGTVDYQQYDRNNILAVPSLLSAIEKRS